MISDRLKVLFKLAKLFEIETVEINASIKKSNVIYLFSKKEKLFFSQFVLLFSKLIFMI